MPIPEVIPQNFPNGLQYLSTVDHLFVKQEIELLQGVGIKITQGIRTTVLGSE